jgi:hypothetical protein
MPLNPFVDRPARVWNEADFAADFVRHRDLAAANPKYLEQVLSRTTMPDGTTDCFTAFMQFASPASASADIPADGIFHALPAGVRVFGYVDEFQTALRTHPGDRIAVSGWACSVDPAGPVKTVRLTIGDRTVGILDGFYSRPEVAAMFGRKELVNVGFQALVYVPNLPPGEYELAATALDGAGHSQTLPTRPVLIDF